MSDSSIWLRKPENWPEGLPWKPPAATLSVEVIDRILTECSSETSRQQREEHLRRVAQVLRERHSHLPWFMEQERLNPNYFRMLAASAWNTA